MTRHPSQLPRQCLAANVRRSCLWPPARLCPARPAQPSRAWPTLPQLTHQGRLRRGPWRPPTLGRPPLGWAPGSLLRALTMGGLSDQSETSCLLRSPNSASPSPSLRPGCDLVSTGHLIGIIRCDRQKLLTPCHLPIPRSQSPKPPALPAGAALLPSTAA